MNDKKLQVLFVSSWYPYKDRPMLGIFVKRHAVALAKVCKVSSIFVYAGDKTSIEETTEEGISTIRASYKKVNTNVPLLSNLVKLKRYNKAWRKAIDLYVQRNGKPDIINLNVIIPAASAAIYVKQKWNIPYVITEHWTGYFSEDGRYKGEWMKSLTKRAVKNASAVITVSNDLKGQMIKSGLNNNYFVIPNIVNTRIFNIASIKNKAGKVRFIHVSALDDKQKNISGLINVFSKLHNVFSQTELIIVGDGGDKLKLEELSKLLGLESCIHFVGQKTEDDLVDLLQSSDAFVLFSNYETQAIVLLEALCCGISVISTKAGGISEYVSSKNGILIEVGNEEQLYSAMSSIVNNRNRFGDPVDIRKTVVEKVDADKIAQQYIDVYNMVLTK